MALRRGLMIGGGGGVHSYASRILSSSCSSKFAASDIRPLLLSYSTRSPKAEVNVTSTVSFLGRLRTAFSSLSTNINKPIANSSSLFRRPTGPASTSSTMSTLAHQRTSALRTTGRKSTPLLRSSPSVRLVVRGTGTTTQSLFFYQPTLLPAAASSPLFTNLGTISQLSNTPPNRGTPAPKNRLTAGLASLGTAGILLAGKGKYILGALKLTKFASLGSMLVTVGTYSIFYGWPFAVGMVGLILVHESGHALVMHRLGIPFKPMVFIPFLGAAVAMKERPRDAYEEALVAFGGPVLGSLGAAGVGAAGIATDSNLLIALADFGFMINLFNLLPIGMMDGGRICGAVSPYAGVVGLGIGGTLIYQGMISNPIFYLVMLAGGWETFQKFYNPSQHVPPHYYDISGTQRASITGGYFALVASLMAAMSISTVLKKSPEQLRRERELGVYHHPDQY